MLLRTQGLSKVFGNKFREIIAVNNVNLSMERGDFLCIIGKSGSGKSTLINMVAGLLNPSSGKVLFDDTDIYSLEEKSVAKFRNINIGYIPQGQSLLPNLTAIDNVRIPHYLSGKDGTGVNEARKLLRDMELEAVADKYPLQLSGGEARRVSIARALMNKPDLLIADEPTGDLDNVTTRNVMDMFLRIKSEGATILMVTHETDVLEYCNRICGMDSGRLSEKLNTNNN